MAPFHRSSSRRVRAGLSFSELNRFITVSVELVPVNILRANQTMRPLIWDLTVQNSGHAVVLDTALHELDTHVKMNRFIIDWADVP
jgi:hypothetical protein